MSGVVHTHLGMLVTSYDRVRHVLGDEAVLKDSFQNRVRFQSLVTSTSKRVLTYLDRDLDIGEVTEFFDVKPNNLEFFVKRFPIESITSIKSDSTGEFSGSEVSEIDFFTGKDFCSAVLSNSVSPALRGLEVVYKGGLSDDAVESIFTVTSPDVGLKDKYVIGDKSGAVGQVSSVDDTGGTVTILCLGGIFDDSEDFLVYNAFNIEDPDVGSNFSGTRDTTSLVEVCPDIVIATEMQIRYLDDHFHNIENSGSEKGKTTRGELVDDYDFLPEVRSILDHHRRILL